MSVAAHPGQEAPFSVGQHVLQQKSRALDDGIVRIEAGIIPGGGNHGSRIIQGKIIVRIIHGRAVPVHAASRIGHAHERLMRHLAGLELRQGVGIKIPVDILRVAPGSLILGLAIRNHLVVILLRGHAAPAAGRGGNAPDIIINVAVAQAAADADRPNLFQLAFKIQHCQQGLGIEAAAR